VQDHQAVPSTRQRVFLLARFLSAPLYVRR